MRAGKLRVSLFKPTPVSDRCHARMSAAAERAPDMGALSRAVEAAAQPSKALQTAANAKGAKPAPRPAATGGETPVAARARPQLTAPARMDVVGPVERAGASRTRVAPKEASASSEPRVAASPPSTASRAPAPVPEAQSPSDTSSAAAQDVFSPSSPAPASPAHISPIKRASSPAAIATAVAIADAVVPSPPATLTAATVEPSPAAAPVEGAVALLRAFSDAVVAAQPQLQNSVVIAAAPMSPIANASSSSVLLVDSAAAVSASSSPADGADQDDAAAIRAYLEAAAALQARRRAKSLKRRVDAAAATPAKPALPMEPAVRAHDCFCFLRPVFALTRDAQAGDATTAPRAPRKKRVRIQLPGEEDQQVDKVRCDIGESAFALYLTPRCARTKAAVAVSPVCRCDGRHCCCGAAAGEASGIDAP